MPEPDPVLAAVRQWLAKADEDLKAAAQLVKMGINAPTAPIGFLAQQCVEKYLKALLIYNGVAFPKTHNIRVILNLVPPTQRPSLPDREQDRLTKFAVESRYPDDSADYISLSEARKTVAIARGIRKHVRRLLPHAARRRRKP